MNQLFSFYIEKLHFIKRVHSLVFFVLLQFYFRTGENYFSAIEILLYFERKAHNIDATKVFLSVETIILLAETVFFSIFEKAILPPEAIPSCERRDW